MRIERNEVSPHRLKDVEDGDWIAIHLASNLGVVLYCEVVGVRTERLRVKVHGTDGITRVPPAQGCPDWDAVVPWSSIAFVRHTKTRPVDCSCEAD